MGEARLPPTRSTPNWTRARWRPDMKLRHEAETDRLGFIETCFARRRRDAMFAQNEGATRSEAAELADQVEDLQSTVIWLHRQGRPDPRPSRTELCAADALPGEYVDVAKFGKNS